MIWLDLLRRFWRPLVIVCAIALAFGAGMYARPARIITVEKEKVVEKLVAGKAEVKTEFRDRVITRVITRTPDGTVTETTKDEDKSRLAETKTEIVYRDRVVEKEVTKVIVDRPRVRIGAMVGYTATRWEKLPALGSEHLLVGLDVHVRVIGPVWLGAFALSSGAAGGSIGVEF